MARYGQAFKDKAVARLLPPESARVHAVSQQLSISVALALSLPAGPERDIVLALTYSVVVFSILVQGLSIGHVTRKAVLGR